MKCSLRFAVSIGCFILIAGWFLVRHFKDILDQYSGASYLVDSFYARFHPESLGLGSLKDSAEAHNVEVGDKIIVMAALEEEDIDWVQEELPEYVPPPPLPRAPRCTDPFNQSVPNHEPLLTHI